jgi:hypothetical protein
MISGYGMHGHGKEVSFQWNDVVLMFN